MGFAFAGAALAVVVCGSWLMFQTMHLRNQVDQLQASRQSEEHSAQQQMAAQRTQQDQLNQALGQERARRAELERELSKRKTQSGLLSFVLMPGLTRDAEGPKPLVIPPDAGSVRFQLDLKSKGVFKSYRAEVQTVEGQQVWSQDVPTPTLTIPARVLPRGDYVIALKGISAGAELEYAGEFYFTVSRK
jgi:hypothetical protein